MDLETLFRGEPLVAIFALKRKVTVSSQVDDQVLLAGESSGAVLTRVRRLLLVIFKVVFQRLFVRIYFTTNFAFAIFGIVC